MTTLRTEEIMQILEDRILDIKMELEQPGTSQDAEELAYMNDRFDALRSLQDELREAGANHV